MNKRSRNPPSTASKFEGNDIVNQMEASINATDRSGYWKHDDIADEDSAVFPQAVLDKLQHDLEESWAWKYDSLWGSGKIVVKSPFTLHIRFSKSMGMGRSGHSWQSNKKGGE